MLRSQMLCEFIRHGEDANQSWLENASAFVVYVISSREDAMLLSHAGMTSESARDG